MTLSAPISLKRDSILVAAAAAATISSAVGCTLIRPSDPRVLSQHSVKAHGQAENAFNCNTPVCRVEFVIHLCPVMYAGLAKHFWVCKDNREVEASFTIGKVVYRCVGGDVSNC
jgi:hypothetical protein